MIGKGKDVGTIRVRDRAGRDVPHDVMLAFAFHAFYPDGTWMLNRSKGAGLRPQDFTWTSADCLDGATGQPVRGLQGMRRLRWGYFLIKDGQGISLHFSSESIRAGSRKSFTPTASPVHGVSCPR